MNISSLQHTPTGRKHNLQQFIQSKIGYYNFSGNGRTIISTACVGQISSSNICYLTDDMKVRVPIPCDSVGVYIPQGIIDQKKAEAIAYVQKQKKEIQSEIQKVRDSIVQDIENNFNCGKKILEQIPKDILTSKEFKNKVTYIIFKELDKRDKALEETLYKDLSRGKYCEK
jgi:hypothetical protein